jgi:hypothetical protein
VPCRALRCCGPRRPDMPPTLSEPAACVIHPTMRSGHDRIPRGGLDLSASAPCAHGATPTLGVGRLCPPRSRALRDLPGRRVRAFVCDGQPAVPQHRQSPPGTFGVSMRSPGRVRRHRFTRRAAPTRLPQYRASSDLAGPTRPGLSARENACTIWITTSACG